MTSISTIDPTGVSAASSSLSNRPDKSELRAAAEQFEAIFVRRMLASARASSLTKDTPFSGEGLEQFQTMRDDHFADLVTQDKGLGLADQIEKQLTAIIRQQSSSDAGTGHAV